MEKTYKLMEKRTSFYAQRIRAYTFHARIPPMYTLKNKFPLLFRIIWNIVALTVFLSILNQLEFHLD